MTDWTVRDLALRAMSLCMLGWQGHLAVVSHMVVVPGQEDVMRESWVS